MRRFLKENSLSLVFGALFLGSLIGQAFAGWHQLNDELFADGLHQLSLGAYLTSASFAVDVTENWQSEYLQFLLYVVLTVWLVQRGSPESKPLQDAGQESDEKQKIGAYARSDSPRLARIGGLRTALYSRSLGIVMGSIFLMSWLGQSVAGWATYNESRLRQLCDPISWVSYLGNADFWARTLQNWQSEFLAVGSMAVLAIYLRQRGSPESKPVGSSHEATGVEG
ncbi:DUF6766 family protein [Nocardioides sp. NPDC047086]|uniref:DUF6766 family protein n=1 Tax=Nocardioides sp. NPDC047086 TaxID=3154810 RepID=UPI0034098EEC